MKSLIIGGDGLIGRMLRAQFRASGTDHYWTSRRRDGAGEDAVEWRRSPFYLDLLYVEDFKLPLDFDVLIMCASMTGFLPCESDQDSYRINVDAPIRLFSQLKSGQSGIFLSSDAVEKALHTNYAMQKALVEMAVTTMPVAIARLRRVNSDNIIKICQGIIAIINCEGRKVYRL